MADASDQMVWKSCLHDLLQEASMVLCGMKQYYLENSENEGDAMCTLREARTYTILSHEGAAKRTMSDHGPEMSTVPLEAQSLKTLSKMKQPRRILEIDMYGGYGVSTLLKGCDNATLASLVGFEMVRYRYQISCHAARMRSGMLLTHSRRCLPQKCSICCPLK